MPSTAQTIIAVTTSIKERNSRLTFIWSEFFSFMAKESSLIFLYNEKTISGVKKKYKLDIGFLF